MAQRGTQDLYNYYQEQTSKRKKENKNKKQKTNSSPYFMLNQSKQSIINIERSSMHALTQSKKIHINKDLIA